MPDTPKTIYWDANCFLSYMNEIAGRFEILADLLQKSLAGDVRIYTSNLSQVEVAFSSLERERQTLYPEVEGQINDLWSDRRPINSVEFNATIGMAARGLIRGSVARGWSLKPLDAIHLATAQWLPNLGAQVDEFHTYDGGLPRYSHIVGFPISEPRVP